MKKNQSSEKKKCFCGAIKKVKQEAFVEQTASPIGCKMLNDNNTHHKYFSFIEKYRKKGL